MNRLGRAAKVQVNAAPALHRTAAQRDGGYLNRGHLSRTQAVGECGALAKTDLLSKQVVTAKVAAPLAADATMQLNAVRTFPPGRPRLMLNSVRWAPMKTTIIPAAFILLLCVSCESPQKASERDEQWSQNIERARSRVLDQLPDLDSASRDMIRTNRPSISYVGLPFGANHWYRWAISSNRVAVLDAGLIPNEVSNKRVTIENPPSARRY